MKTVKFLSMVLIAAFAGAWLLVEFTVAYVPVGFVGVRTREYALLGEKGVEPRDFQPGWHWDIGPLHTFIFFDSTVQTLEMTRNPQYGDRKEADHISVQSADGYSVAVDVTIKYRIQEEKAHLVYANTGSGIKYKIIVRNESRATCLGLFGTMKTEDFYDPIERRNKSAEAREVLKKNLEDNYIQVIDVLIRNVQFDPEYENKIRRKKLADQEVELNKSMAKAATMRGKTQVIEAETEKLVKIITKEKEAELVRMEAQTNREIAKIRAEYEKYATEKRADADLVVAQKEAEGKLLVKRAEAEGERLRNLAMQGVGGNTIVALEAAKNLNLSTVGMSSLHVDFLDLDEMATKLGVPKNK
jgi:regulator of protease activity HflC (stomatin/prohibitin superfamily)